MSTRKPAISPHSGALKFLIVRCALLILFACGIARAGGANFMSLASDPSTERCPDFSTDCGTRGNSCFAAETPILVEGPDGSWQWRRADQIEAGMRLAALDDNSTPSRPSLTPRTIREISRDPTNAGLRVLTLSNGQTLKVTPNHAMLRSDGQVVTARTLSVGSRLVGVDGEVVRVSAISFERTQNDVYHFEVSAESADSHTIVAGFLLSPDLWWQKQLAGNGVVEPTVSSVGPSQAEESNLDRACFNACFRDCIESGGHGPWCSKLCKGECR